MTARADIRPFQPSDLDALYAIALATGDAGQDASALYEDPQLVGHIYAAPYALLEPQCAFVVEDEQGVGGYIVGTADTRRFEARLEAEWWPKLRERYPAPESKTPTAWTADEQRAWLIHNPFVTPERIVASYPAHLHINLLPRLQGRELGRRAIRRFLGAVGEAGARGIHLGCSMANTRALRFYDAYGFTEIERSEKFGTVWMGFIVPDAGSDAP
ncbi:MULTISPECIES: GNAT family N-acetyltransferase [Alphaproteobacteria]|uniref:GNAT family N-acetyltransferase n=1 Tax=Alphaproteobacteria TaxID=28211 RepID=UPI00272F9F1F|nr:MULTISPECIES: GNAT family N-acetyltransferase [Alphaproteobacteria]MDP1626698.1 GNAT family N-acetyltransferase [Parvibaculum sp.]MDP2213871.1 GNAT family N-acetyltransferase [Phenylobacterium sp.]MDP3330199.1 GNAT family N-acetyltransferase [Parvibaculum sp.]